MAYVKMKVGVTTNISQKNGTIFEPIDRRIQVNVSGLVFSPQDWFELHHAGFTSIDDKIQGGNIMYYIALYTAGDDPAYDGTLLASFELHVKDPNLAKVRFIMIERHLLLYPRFRIGIEDILENSGNENKT